MEQKSSKGASLVSHSFYFILNSGADLVAMTFAYQISSTLLSLFSFLSIAYMSLCESSWASSSPGPSHLPQVCVKPHDIPILVPHLWQKFSSLFFNSLSNPRMSLGVTGCSAPGPSPLSQVWSERYCAHVRVRTSYVRRTYSSLYKYKQQIK